MDRGAWRAAIHGVAESQTRRSRRIPLTPPQKASGIVEQLGQGVGAARGNPPGEGTPELSAVN